MVRISTLSTRLIAVLFLFVFTSVAPAVAEEATDWEVGKPKWESRSGKAKVGKPKKRDLAPLGGRLIAVIK